MLFQWSFALVVAMVGSGEVASKQAAAARSDDEPAPAESETSGGDKLDGAALGGVRTKRDALPTIWNAEGVGLQVGETTALMPHPTMLDRGTATRPTMASVAETIGEAT